jgi:Orsellinic acid/F9775 biosynthesis cluster protein D
MASEISKYVLYLEGWKVLVCLNDKCGHCLVPTSVGRHLRIHHKGCYDLQLRQRIEQYASQLRLAEPSDVRSPIDTPPPIEGLKVLKGWRCQRCHRVGVEINGAILHCRKEHEWTSSKGKKYSEEITDDSRNHVEGTECTDIFQRVEPSILRCAINVSRCLDVNCHRGFKVGSRGCERKGRGG